MRRLIEFVVLVLLLANSAPVQAATPTTNCLRASTSVIDVDHDFIHTITPVIYADSPNKQFRIKLSADGTVSITPNGKSITTPPANYSLNSSIIHWTIDSLYVAVTSQNMTEIWSAKPAKMLRRIAVGRVFGSPVGDQFAYWIKDKIYRFNADDQTETTYPMPDNISLDCPECIWLVWANDGSAVTLVYQIESPDSGEYQAYQVINLKSGHIFQDTGISLANADGPGRSDLAEWINGQWVYLHDSTSGPTISVIDPKTGSRTIRFSGIVNDFFEDPADTIIVSTDYAPDTQESLLLMNYASGKTSTVSLGGNLTNNPVWSWNGRYLVAFVDPPGTPIQRQMIWFNAQGAVLHKANITTASLSTAAGPDPGVGAIRDVIDDGTVVFAASTEKGIQIRRIGLNSKEEILLNNIDAPEIQHWEYDWDYYPAPKGPALALYFPRWLAGQHDLYLVPGNGKTPVYFSAKVIGNTIWSSDGSRIAIWAGEYAENQSPPVFKNTVVTVLTTGGVKQFSKPVTMAYGDPFEWIVCP